MIKIDFKFKKIKCPRHDHALELYIDENNDNFSIIAWYCKHCDGFWYEDFFLDRLYRKYDYLNVSALKNRFKLKCPVCNSNKIKHSCVPECCTDHTCSNCNTDLELVGKLLNKSEYLLNDNDYSNYMISMWGAGVGYKDDLRGYKKINFRSNSRKSRDGELLELYIADRDNFAERVIWVSEEYRFKYYENSYIKRPDYFIPVSRPGFLCEVCDLSDFDSISENSGQCANCKSIYSFELKPRVSIK